MKTLFLLFSRLKSYYIKNKTIFILFFLGSILSTFALMFFYEETLSLREETIAEIDLYRQYAVHYRGISEENSSASGFLKQFVEKYENDNRFEQITVERKFYSEEQNDNHVVRTVWKGNYNLSRYEGKVEPENLDNNEIILSLNSSHKVGDRFKISGVEFLAVGRHVQDFFFVSPDAFDLLGGLAHSIYFIHDYKAEESIVDIKNELEENFSTFPVFVQCPYEPQFFIQSWATQRFIQALLCYLTSAIAYLILLHFLLNSLMNENTISVFVGAKKADLSFFIFWETLILTLLPSILGLLSYRFLFSNIVSLGNFVTLEYHEYLLVFMIIFIETLALLIPFNIFYKSKHPIELRRLS